MEDKDFYKHKGIDIKAIIRAVIANTENDEIVQGASTITQQLAKNIFLSQEVTWQTKSQKRYLLRHGIWRRSTTKNEILEFYLKQYLFQLMDIMALEQQLEDILTRRLSELSLAEQVFIAAIPNSPTRYNPLTNYDNTDGQKKSYTWRSFYENNKINARKIMIQQLIPRWFWHSSRRYLRIIRWKHMQDIVL